MTETLATRNADCLLTVTVNHQPTGQLDLHYQVQNHGESALYLCSQFYELPATDEADASPQLTPNRVHIQVEAAGVHVDKAVMDLSFHDGIRVMDIPYLTQVLPGRSYEQALSLELPLLPYRVHGGRPGQAPPVALPLRFSLGYFKGEAGITASEVVAGIYQAALSHNREQQVLTVGPFQELMPVANATTGPAPTLATSAAEWTPWG
jgi:hypothetical protein